MILSGTATGIRQVLSAYMSFMYDINKNEPHRDLWGLCSRYLSSRAVTRQVLSAYMSLTSVFGMGSDGSAAGGGYSDPSEWLRSAVEEAAPPATKMPGTATGNRWTLMTINIFMWSKPLFN